MRRLVPVLVLLLVFAPLAPLHAEDESHPILTTLREALMAAGEDGLVLVVLDPSLAHWTLTEPEEPFSDEILECASLHMVVCRLHPGAFLSAGRLIRSRYGLWDRVGAAVVIDGEFSLFARDVPSHRAGLVKALKEAKENHETYRKRRSIRGRSTRREIGLALGRLHVEHCAFGHAVRVFESLEREQPLEADDLEALADAYWKSGKEGKSRDAYERLIETFPDDERRVEWLITLATLGVCPVRTALLRHGLEDPGIRRDGKAALRPLLAQVRTEGDVRAEAAVRMALLDYLEGDAEQVAECEWITTHDPLGPHAIDAWYRLHSMAIAWNDTALAKRHLVALIAAQPEAERRVPWARDVRIPMLDRFLEAGEHPEENPFLLEVSAEPGEGESERTYVLRVVVRNRSKRELRDVSVDVHLAGPAEPLTAQRVEFARFEPQTVRELSLDLKATGTEPIHVVVLVQRLAADELLTERGKHVRIDPPK